MLAGTMSPYIVSSFLMPFFVITTQLRMDVSLVRSADARAKFFDCSLVPIDDAFLGRLV